MIKRYLVALTVLLAFAAGLAFAAPATVAGKIAAIPGYRVGGKTGTAQEFNEDCKCYRGVVASFIGMAPADAPRLVVAVSIFNPRVGRFGGDLGGPVFKRVMTYALQARQIPPTGKRAPTLPLTYGG